MPRVQVTVTSTKAHRSYSRKKGEQRRARNTTDPSLWYRVLFVEVPVNVTCGDACSRCYGGTDVFGDARRRGWRQLDWWLGLQFIRETCL